MSKRRQNLSEEEIDEIVVAQADDDAAWEEPIQVRRSVSESYSLPSELAARAAFLAQLHRARIEEWLTLVIQERIELEEGAFAEAKRALAKDGRAALNVSVSPKESSFRRKLRKTDNPEELTLLFAREKPVEIANNLGIRILHLYIEKVRETRGVDKSIVDKAVKNLEQALELKTRL